MARRIIQSLAIIVVNIAPSSLNKFKLKKIVVVSAENSKIIAYSLRKIRINPVAPYSILKPETSSDSPSEKSNGVRFVSAIQDTTHRKILNGAKINKDVKKEFFNSQTKNYVKDFSALYTSILPILGYNLFPFDMPG